MSGWIEIYEMPACWTHRCLECGNKRMSFFGPPPTSEACETCGAKSWSDPWHREAAVLEIDAAGRVKREA